MGKRIKLLLGMLLICLSGAAQQGDNPFELPDRSVETTDPQVETTTAVNPFELNARPAIGKSTDKTVERRPDIIRKPGSDLPPLSARFKLWMSIVFVSILTVLVNLYKSTLNNIYRSFLNDNFLKMVHRDQGTVLAIPYLIFYAFALINIGIFVFVVLRHFNIRFFESDFISMISYAGGVMLLFFSKHLLLLLLGYIFPVKKEFHQYNFTIIIFGVILGLLLIPAVFLISYAPAELTRPVIYGTFIVVGLVYLYRILRSLFIGLRFISLHKFHFFVYLCTIEIAPVLILLKLVTGPWF